MNKTTNVHSPELTKGSLLVTNTIWNTLGLVLPLFVGLFSIPILIEGLGTERFGILTIIWMIIGYFSIFDFGLGMALTKLIAQKIGEDSYKEIPELFWTAITIMSIAGVMGSVVMWMLSEHIIFDWLNVENLYQEESLTSFYILCFSIPVVILTTGFRGLLEAYQEFPIINMIRVPLGVLTFLGPIAVLSFTTSLAWIVAILLIGRILGLYAHYHYCIKIIPNLKHNISYNKYYVMPLMSFGGWMTISNIIGPMMVYLDRFIIGSVLTMTAVSFYVAPYEMVTKLWMIPMGLIGVLFPAFSALLSSDKNKAAMVFDKGINIIFYLMLPIFLFINLFAFEGINLWLGAEFAKHSTSVIHWLSIGVFLNCVARMPFIMIQSAGRPDLISKLYLFELIPYILSVWYAATNYGISGVAFVWMARVLIDTLIILIMSKKVVSQLGRLPVIFIYKLLLTVIILYFVTFIDDMQTKILLFVLSLIIDGILAWYFIITKYKIDV